MRVEKSALCRKSFCDQVGIYYNRDEKVKTAVDNCNPYGYNIDVIVSFLHKGLERFYRSGNAAGIQVIHAKKLRLILTLLDAATEMKAMYAPGLGLHKLKGDKKNLWAVTVQANRRVTFRFVAGNAEVVNYEDYH